MYNYGMAKAVKGTQGCVYFLLAPSVRRLKIGFSIKLDSRVNDLRLGSPIDLILVKYICGTLQLEITLLALFDRFRLHGEWFEAEPELMDFVEQLPHGEHVTPDELVKNF